MRILSDSERDAPIELVGGKAQGLFTLKSLESRLNSISLYSEVIVSPFFVVPADMNLTDMSSSILEEARKIGSLYAARSSSRLEDNGDNSFDGIFETYLNVPLDKLVEVIHHVRKSATSQRARQYADEVGIELEESMPVIVQQMVTEQTHKGVVYSRFPCPKDLLKIIRDDCYENGKRHINALLRETKYDGTHYLLLSNPTIVSRDWGYMESKIESLGLVALAVEDEIKHPVIMEFSCYNPASSADKFRINPLQARKLTKISEGLKFSMPQLQDRGLIASTYDLNGTGDFTGEGFVVIHRGTDCVDAEGLEEFDRSHPQGYVLVTPYLQFYDSRLDYCTPNKKGVVAYTDLGEHHDMEISRKKRILYLNTKDSLGPQFFRGIIKYMRKLPIESDERFPIETGEIIRIVSDGEMGFVFNLSRK